MELKEFNRELMSRMMEANKDFLKCEALKAFLDHHAELLDQTHHRLAYGIARGLINHIGGRDDKADLTGWGSLEVVHREYKNVVAGLLEDDSSFMIRLLAERAALCWLHVQAAEVAHNTARRITEGRTLKIRAIEAAEKRLTMAQNRFLRACAALTKARAMIAAPEILKARQGGQAKPRLKLATG